MKLITLNTWCGKIYEPLISFIKQHSNDTDIFCFQEIRNGYYENKEKGSNEWVDMFRDIKKMLPNHNGYFSEMSQGVGIATFINSKIKVEKVDTHEILSKEDTHHIKMEDGWSYYARLMQSIKIKNKDLIIHNFHGIPGNLKKDTPERKLQTERILEIINKNNEKQIIVGDFNLDIKTEAISLLGSNMRNLIQEGNFTTTRNSNYKKQSIMPFADYVFISKEIEVKNFQVLQDEVSDHLALLLEFN